MEKKIQSQSKWITILRWTARIVALLFAAFILLMFIGESSKGLAGGASLQERDYIMLSLWALYFIGLLLGLKWEGSGGIFSLVFLLIHIIVLKVEGSNVGIYFYILGIPSILYILSWYFQRRLTRQQ